MGWSEFGVILTTRNLLRLINTLVLDSSECYNRSVEVKINPSSKLSDKMRNFIARLKRHRVSIMRANPYAYRLDRLQHRLRGVVFVYRCCVLWCWRNTALKVKVKA